MLVEWLYRTTFELSLLIGLVLLARPVVRRALGANAAYRLWCIPLLRAVLVDRPERPQLFIESLGPATGNFDVFPAPATWAVPGGIPWGAVWIAGAFVWMAVKLLAWFRFRAALEACAEPLDVRLALPASTPGASAAQRVRFLACDLPGTPFVTGLVKPRICLPPDFAERFKPRQQAWIIQHELVHVARYDLWVQLIWGGLRAVFWFNPLVHLASSALRDDQELACDQAIVGRSDADARLSYGKTLIASAGARPHPISIPFFGKHKERIAMIARHRASTTRQGLGIALCAALGACALTSPSPEVPALGSGQPITARFVELDVRAVFQLLGEFSGTSIVVAEQVPQVNVSIAAQDVPWDEVLARLVSCVGAELDRSGNVIVIRPAADGAGTGDCRDIEVTERPI